MYTVVSVRSFYREFIFLLFRNSKSLDGLVTYKRTPLETVDRTGRRRSQRGRVVGGRRKREDKGRKPRDLEYDPCRRVVKSRCTF